MIKRWRKTSETTGIPKVSAQGQWSSRLSFVLAATGAAVGLGNIWKFPYMVGDNGGSAFVLVYLICVVLIGMPVMVAEILIGRCGRQNPVNSLASLARVVGYSERWSWVGWWGAGTLLIVLSFYSVVSGWSLAYIQYAWTGVLSGLDAAGVNHVWQDFLVNPWRLLAWHTVFMVLTVWVVVHGVRQGLERAVRWMMPALFLILLLLVAYAYTTNGFGQAVRFLFDFHVHKITMSVVISAMGHALFSLAVGAGCLLVYGSYLPAETRIGSTVTVITVLNLLVAVLAGLAIFPLVFAHHLTPQEGPGLMFEVLPIAFAQMPGGQFFGGLFFILLLFAAWTSSISLLEPLVVLVMERFSMGRLRAGILVGILAWLLGILSLLSFNVWADYRLLGRWTIFGALTDLSTNVMLPVGSLGFAVFVGWRMSDKTVRASLAVRHERLYRLWIFLLRFITPLGITVILVSAW